MDPSEEKTAVLKSLSFNDPERKDRAISIPASCEIGWPEMAGGATREGTGGRLKSPTKEGGGACRSRTPIEILESREELDVRIFKS